ncbi:MAG TPA: hypothetical protein VKW08_08070 [Xanthobacteraceae bacterium]|jgi:hypothetical protein|nr:hypothetical protein [Xanthobacteraceae bacterium]
MSAIGRELRAMADDLWRSGDHALASFAHSHALKLEATLREAQKREPRLIDIEDCIAVYGDDLVDEVILIDLDINNSCADPGGHVFLTENGEVKCMRCGRPGMPVYAMRESE